MEHSKEQQVIPVVLTATDPLQQRLFPISEDELSSFIKTTVILSGKTTVTHSAMLDSELTSKVLKSGRVLLNKGLIAPDIREDAGSYNTLFAQLKNEGRLLGKDFSDTADFLDENASSRFEYKPVNLSQQLKANLKNAFFMLTVADLSGLNLNELDQLLSAIDKKENFDREWLFLDFPDLMKRTEVMHWVQFHYHLLGGLALGAVPSWPDSFNPIFNKMVRIQERIMAMRDWNADWLLLIKKHNLICSDVYPYSECARDFITVSIRADEFGLAVDVVFDPSQREKLETWDDVYHIRERVVGKFENLSTIVNSDCAPADLNDLRSQISRKCRPAALNSTTEPWNIWKKYVYRWLNAHSNDPVMDLLWENIEATHRDADCHETFGI
ncbi:MAG: hypothetical protein JXR25_17410 [Pontiellaceae bacterium]|nr:hypothetical protein [Pontiellaceae bacterium]MBN2786599.1 hypothetical protein [Pontiellaceae bacterium]